MKIFSSTMLFFRTQFYLTINIFLSRIPLFLRIKYNIRSGINTSMFIRKMVSEYKKVETVATVKQAMEFSSLTYWVNILRPSLFGDFSLKFSDNGQQDCRNETS